MNRIRISLSIIIAAALCWGCAAKKEEDRGSSSAASAQDKAMLEKKVLGAYGVDGSDYLFSKGTMQLSRRYSGRTVEFSMLDLENKGIYSLSGVRTEVVKGDNFQTVFTVTRSKTKEKELTSVVRVLAISGDTLWLKSSKDAYFIVKK